MVPTPPAEASDANRTTESLATANPGVLAETTRTPYFAVLGAANYTVTNEGMTLTTGLPLRVAVASPFPMLQVGAREVRGAADGSESELSRIVRYVLTTAAQFRALQGFAAGAFGEPDTGTTDVLGPRDVEVAVNLALLLEELRRFRDVDPASVAAFDAAFFEEMAGAHAGEPLTPPVSDRPLGRLLDAYARGGTADPADLFALYAAFDADPVRLNRVLAQALSAVIDQSVLRVLRYFGVEWVADYALQGEQLLAQGVDEFLDWLEGGKREAEAVRAYVRDLFGMATEPATFLGAYTMPLPDREYTATNADGSVRSIRVPAHAAPIEFDAVDFLAGRDDLWGAYYAMLYKEDLRTVHATAREFLTDLATNVAEDLNLIGAIPNPSLRGRIDPKDSKSLLEFVRDSLTTAIDTAVARLRSDPSYLGELVVNLWRAEADAVRHLIDFLLASYNVLADWEGEMATARSRLAIHLEGLAPLDPDFWDLDTEGLASLQKEIAADADGPWVPDAYRLVRNRDAARLEHIYAVATDAATPPEGGGIYQALLDTVLGATGLLIQAGDLLRTFGRALAAGDDLHNTKILVPTPEAPFEFWTGNRSGADARNAVLRERVAVHQTPALLRMTRSGDPGAWDPASLEPGDLWVDLRDPSTVPRSRNSPNVHWTDIRGMSERPFETRWDVRVLGLVRLDAMSARGVRFGPEGILPEVAREDVRIDFRLNVTVYSGWPLAGVAYKDSTTFAKEFWDRVRALLGELWDRILGPVVDRVLDEVHAFVGILLDVVRRAMDSEAAKALAEAVRVTVDALQEYALRQLGPLAPVVEILVDEARNGNVSFDTLGLNLTVGPGPPPASVKLTGWKDDVEFYAVLVLKGFDRRKPITVRNAPVDLKFGFTYYADDVTLTLEGDVLAITGGQLVTVRAVPTGGGWSLEFVVPAIDAARVYTPWWFQFPPIPTPLGTLTIELGVEIRYRLRTSVDWALLLARAFTETLDATGGFPESSEDIGPFVAEFADRMLMNLADLFVSGLVELREFSLYIEGVFGAADAAGAGFRVAFVMDGRAVVEILKWLIHNLIRFLRTFPVVIAEVEYEGFPEDLLDSFSVRIEAFATVGLPRFMANAGGEDVPSRVRADVRVQPNLPALLNAWRPEAGTWRVDFGVYLEQVPAPVADAFFHTGTETPDVWFLKGAVVETAP